LVRALPAFAVVDVVLAVTVLHRSGELERVGVATYRHPTDAPARVAMRNDALMWGETA
jgi:hypothetical protein